jgi:hypothetical protein
MTTPYIAAPYTLVQVFRSLQLWNPTHTQRRKQLHLHLEVVDNIHIVYDISLDDLLPYECQARAVHGVSAVGAELSL